MTLDQALRLNVGEYVTHRLTTPQHRPIRVTDVWINERRSVVSVRLASLDRDAWLDATGYELPPPGTRWDPSTLRWLTAQERRELYPHPQAGAR